MSLSVSVVIPTYNRRALLGRAIASVGKQLLPGDEIIVIDDGSTDGTEIFARGLPSPVRFIRQERRGAGAARNAGISLCSNDLVCFLDSDDEWLPGKLDIQRELMTRHPELLFCFSNFAATDVSGFLHPKYLVSWNQDTRSWDEILGPRLVLEKIEGEANSSVPVQYHIGDLAPVEFQGAYVLTSTVAVRRVAAGHALRFAEDVSTFEDLECFGRLSLAGPACFIANDTAIQHGQAPDRLSGKPPIEQAEAHLKIIRRVWGESTAFRALHETLYQKVERKAALQYAAELIAVGKSYEARTALSRIASAPVLYRLLASLPQSLCGSVSRAALAAKATILAGWEQFSS